jgi:hypothetical protein
LLHSPAEVEDGHAGGQLPPAAMTPWAEGDMPFSESVDLNEYPKQLLKLRQCRSFRADLRHKLEIIVRAHGGWGLGGVRRAARALQVNRFTLRRWYQWVTVPRSRLLFERIDEAYDSALETLAKRVATKRKARLI